MKFKNVILFLKMSFVCQFITFFCFNALGDTSHRRAQEFLSFIKPEIVYYPNQAINEFLIKPTVKDEKLENKNAYVREKIEKGKSYTIGAFFEKHADNKTDSDKYLLGSFYFKFNGLNVETASKNFVELLAILTKKFGEPYYTVKSKDKKIRFSYVIWEFIRKKDTKWDLYLSYTAYNKEIRITLNNTNTNNEEGEYPEDAGYN
jgi:hypothetical protein